MTRQAPSRKFGDTDSSSSEDEDAGTSIKRSSDPPAKKVCYTLLDAMI